MISIKNPSLLPSPQKLQNLCKALSVLDSILSQEWEYRYYSYNKDWSDHEEFFEMRDGSGNQMLILFTKNGCVINGFAHEYPQPNKQKLTANLPSIFYEFIFGEPVASIGTTFCLWANSENQWQTGQLEYSEDHSEELLKIFNGNPQTYIDWATEYFEDSYKESGIPLETVTKIYNGQTLTKEMVLSIVDELEDWEQLENDLQEIGYPYQFK
ncbi:hypothetical protein VUJ46_11765 [Chryseobacterium sp. MYb264]|uniref:hypothetical protein n=1 Tax=Chryseobacterium sp. MYb264 TaxID=2745153 RepID=UPI002E107700|nr:hypothetical protein VUJ46_11765 [Chryseobacterium sp. MYb264]